MYFIYLAQVYMTITFIQIHTVSNILINLPLKLRQNATFLQENTKEKMYYKYL